MTPSEVFAQMDEEVVYLYWMTELAISNTQRFYSLLDAYSSEADRTCGTCGHVNQTNEFGRVDGCENPPCVELKSYFSLQVAQIKYTKITRPKQSLPIIKNRQQFLTSRMKEDGFKTCQNIPKETRFQYLLTLMLLRVAHEKKTCSGEFKDET